MHISKSYRYTSLLKYVNFINVFCNKIENYLHILFAYSWWIQDMNTKLRMLKEDENFLSFVFVRHPLDRLESAYYDKIVVKPGTELGQYWSQLLIQIHRKCKFKYRYLPTCLCSKF